MPKRGPGGAALALALLGCVLAVFGGMIATTASPILVGVFAGAVLGGFLLFAPQLALWLCVVGAFLGAGAISLFFPSLNKATWLISLLGLFLTLASLLVLLTDAKRRAAVPGFVWLAYGFMAYALLLGPLMGSMTFEYLSGFKRYFQLWGVMFALALLAVSEANARRLLKFMFAVLLLQLPFALYQLIALVPLRRGLGGGVVPIDVVSGTFEASMLGGGNSSTLVLFLCIMLALVLAAWRERLVSPARALLLLCFCIVPMGLGETKIVVLFLPITLMVYGAKYFRKNPVTSALIVLIGLALTVVLFYLYVTVFASVPMSIEERLQKTIDYNFGNAGYLASYSLNRTTAITHWWSVHGMSNPIQTVFGHGLGTAYFSPTALAPGHVAAQYGNIGIGLTAASTLLWEQGLFGLCWLLLVHVFAWRTLGRLARAGTTGWANALVVALRASLLLFTLMLLYTGSMLDSLSTQCLWMLTLGGVAFVARGGFLQSPPPVRA